MAKKNLSDKLAKLKAKLEDTDLGGGGGNEGFWSPKKGDSMIRIAPEVGDMEFFFQEVGQHRLPDGTYFKCASFTTAGELPCPICDLVNSLYKMGSPDAKDLAGKLRVNKRYWMNIIVRDMDNDTEGETADGPYIFTPGVLIFRTVYSLINNPEYGDITDLDDGTDLIINRQGEGLDTKYEVYPRRRVTPFHVDRDTEEDILDRAADLSYVVLSEDPEEDQQIGEGYIIRLLPYGRLVAESGLDPNMSFTEIEHALESRKSNSDDAASSARRILKQRKKASDPVDEALQEAEAAPARRSRRR